MVKQPFAKTFGPEEAAELLAKTSAADFKCDILSLEQRDQLQIYLAQAEITLAGKSNVTVTKAALKRGKELGAKVVCDSTTRKAVQGVYLAAHETLAKQEVVENVEVVQDQEPVPIVPAQPKVVAEKPAVEQPAAKPIAVAKAEPNPALEARSDIEARPITHKSKAPQKVQTVKARPAAVPTKPIIVTSKPTKKPVVAQPVSTASLKPLQKILAQKTANKNTQDERELDRYALLARDYYAELKCRNMSKSSVTAFYNDVVRTHKTAVGAFGGRRVGAVLKKAQAEALSTSCG